MEPTFIHLHNHSEYSILDGAVKIDDLVDAAYENNMPAVALTDHGNIFGAVQFFKAGQGQGRQAHPRLRGLRRPAEPLRQEAGRRPTTSTTSTSSSSSRTRRATGTSASSSPRAYLEGFYYRPRIDKELLAAHSEGLIGLSSCLKGEVASWLARGFPEKAEEAARDYAAIFAPGDFYLELQDHGLPRAEGRQPPARRARPQARPAPRGHERHPLRRAGRTPRARTSSLCIQTNRKISDPDRLKFSTDQFYFKSGGRWPSSSTRRPTPSRTRARSPPAATSSFPSKSLLPARSSRRPTARRSRSTSRRSPGEGFRARHGPARRPKRRERRAPPTLRANTRSGSSARSSSSSRWASRATSSSSGTCSRPPARRASRSGRAAARRPGSLLAYCLEITEIDPIEYDLLFERFLNPERISLPDIDIDFCGRRRQEMIEYVTEKYGQENVCQIITFGTMAARAAIRDVGRVLEVPAARGRPHRQDDPLRAAT